MTTKVAYTVAKVRMEQCPGKRWGHIAGLITNDNYYWTRAQVAQSIRAGNIWRTWANGHSAAIYIATNCSHCYATPYLTTRPDGVVDDNLDNLPKG